MVKVCIGELTRNSTCVPGWYSTLIDSGSNTMSMVIVIQTQVQAVRATSGANLSTLYVPMLPTLIV